MSRPLTHTGDGLSSVEAAAALLRHGPNAVPAAGGRSGLLAQVLEQLRDPMILVLLAAGVLTSATGDRADTLVIALVVVANTAVGVVQRRRADRTMAALRELSAPVASVVRDGQLATVSGTDVVPGDLVVLKAGDLVPADGRLIDVEGLLLDESSMTGEADAVPRDVEDDLVAGTLVVRGRGRLVITATGKDSGLGRLAMLVRSAPVRRTPLQDRMRHLSAALVVAVLGLTAVVVLAGLLRGEPLTEMLVVGASLAVAAVPESLPAVMTVALATGAHRMAQQSAVVRRLSAVETLGSVTVIATDKTGTLTTGRMTGESTWLAEDVAREDLLRDVVLCNDAIPTRDDVRRSGGDPIDAALLQLALSEGLDVEGTRRDWPRVSEVPFDAHARRMTTRHLGPTGEDLGVVKGAPEHVLDLVPEEERRAAVVVADGWASRGQRVLAVVHELRAAADTSGGWHLVGLVGFVDPPRESSAGVVRHCHDAGIDVVVVTGDHALTAAAVAGRVGIRTGGDALVDGSGVSDAVRDGDLRGISVFSRVQPEQKVEIVDALQTRGEVVAMLGDGVNDAPALRHADIGVAAGCGGTEVARQAADLVLLDDNLATVVTAIREGRRIFTNLRLFLVYAVAGGVSEVGIMLLGPFVGMALPLLPSQILWVNLLTHGLTGVAFSGEPADPRDMTRPPIARTARVLERADVLVLGLAASALVSASVVAGHVADAGQRRTVVFLALGLGQLGVAAALRRSWGHGALRHPGLPLALLGSVLLMLAAVGLPPLRDLLSTRTLAVHDVLVAAVAAVVPGLVVLVADRARRRG